MGQVWPQSALWIGLALIASIVSIRVAISAPLVGWVNFPAGFGAILLTFLAGAEIDPGVVRQRCRSELSIGVLGFFAQYLGVLACAHYAIRRLWDQAQIAGISLSTTSVAAIYAVMVESGFNRTALLEHLLRSGNGGTSMTTWPSGLHFKASLQNWIEREIFA